MMTGQILAMLGENQAAAWLVANRQELQARIQQLRQIAKPFRDRQISDATLQQYRDDFRRVEQAGGIKAASGSAASYWKLRAAASRVLADRIYEVLAKADRIRKADPGLVGGLRWAAVVMDELEPLGDQLAAARAEKWDKKAAKPRERCHRQRGKLARLPADWRGRIWSRVGKGKYADAVAVAAIAGVRPAELEKGVRVARAKDGSFVFLVMGAKVREAAGEAKRGQKERGVAVKVAAGDPMAEHLRRLVANGPKIVRVRTARRFSYAFCKASEAAFPKLTAPPSLYAFRHAFCAEAKAGGLTPEQVAHVMGHASCESQKHYGMRQQGRGGLSIVPVGKLSTAIRPAAPRSPPPSQAPAPSARREARAIAAAIGHSGPSRPRGMRL